MSAATSPGRELSPLELHYRALVLQCSHPGSVAEPNALVMALWTDDPAPIVAGMSRAQRVALWADLEGLADQLDPWITHQAKPARHVASQTRQGAA